MRFPMTENIDESEFNTIIASIIATGDSTKLSTCIPRTSPLKKFHLSGLLNIAKKRKELILMVRNFFYNFKNDLEEAEFVILKEEIDSLYNSIRQPDPQF